MQSNYIEQHLTFSLDEFQQTQSKVFTCPPFCDLPYAHTHREALFQILQQVFSIPSFRPLQLDALQQTLDRKYIVCLFPTGYGKTLMYQLPAAYQYGVTVVFSPPYSLISDQQRRLDVLGITSVWIKVGLQMLNWQ